MKNFECILGIVATATILITLNTNQMYGSIMKAPVRLVPGINDHYDNGLCDDRFQSLADILPVYLVLLMIIGA